MKNLKKIANKNSKTKLLSLEQAKNYYTEKRERERYNNNNNNNFIYFTALTVVIGLLQFYKFLIISKIEDGVR